MPIAISFNNQRIYEDEVCGPRAPFGAPDWNLLPANLGRCLTYLQRPVPVVFLRLAFSLQFPVAIN